MDYKKCPICGKAIYIDGKNNNFACVDENCIISSGWHEYLEEIFTEPEIIKSSRNCEEIVVDVDENNHLNLYLSLKQKF